MLKLLIDEQFLPELKTQIQEAQQKIYAILYFVRIRKSRKNDDVKNILSLLLQAKQRHIDIKFLINRNLRLHLFSVHNTDFANELQKNNIDARITDSNRTTHCKAWIFDDDRVIIGSHNLSNSSLHVNREISLLIHDADLNSQLTAYFKEEHEKTRQTWQKSGSN